MESYGAARPQQRENTPFEALLSSTTTKSEDVKQKARSATGKESHDLSSQSGSVNQEDFTWNH